MLRLFQAGLVAAFSQFIAVGLATLVVSLSARHGLIAPASSDIGPAFDSQSASISPLFYMDLSPDSTRGGTDQ